MRALLDINVLIALLDADRRHHERGGAVAEGERAVWLGVLPADAQWLYLHHVAARISECGPRNCGDAARRHAYRADQGILAEIHGDEKFLQQHFPGVDILQFGHMPKGSIRIRRVATAGPETVG